MPKIHNIEGCSTEQIRAEIAQGGKFVIYMYTISIVVMTFKRSTDIYYIPPGGSSGGKAAIYTLITLVLGWWGIPWGPIYTISALIDNLGGGKNVTREVMHAIQ